MALSSEANPIA